MDSHMDATKKQHLTPDDYRQDDPQWIAAGLLYDKFRPLFEQCETQEQAQRVVDWIMRGLQDYIREQRRLKQAAGEGETP
jgi:hypothetical protein